MAGVMTDIGIPPPSPLAGVLERFAGCRAELEPKRPGRPLKRSDSYLHALLAEHDRVSAWFADRFARPARSDRELYRTYFEDQLARLGQRASKAGSARFQGSLKTLSNELALARALTRSVPATPVFPGRGGECNEGVQRDPQTPEEVHRGS